MSFIPDIRGGFNDGRTNEDIRYVNLTTQERSYKASFFEFVNAFQVYGTDPVVPHYVPT